MCNSSSVKNDVNHVSSMLTISSQEAPWHRCWRALKSLPLCAVTGKKPTGTEEPSGRAERSGLGCPFAATQNFHAPTPWGL